MRSTTKRWAAALVALLLVACAAAKTPSPQLIQQLSATAQGVAALGCSRLSADQKAAAVPILIRVMNFDDKALLTFLEAVPASDTGALGFIWHAVHLVLDNAGWIDNYAPVARSAAHGCLSAAQT
jgi:hypothetical protein